MNLEDHVAGSAILASIATELAKEREQRRCPCDDYENCDYDNNN